MIAKICKKYIIMGKNMNTIELIENYVIYLITECSLSVTIHPKEKESLITFSRLMRFNVHANSYCTLIKSTERGQKRCLICQDKVLMKCKEGECAFLGTCYAGVTEYVYPFFKEGRVIGFVSVGAYAKDGDKERVKKAADTFGYSEDALIKGYNALTRSIPDKKRIDTLVLPLCQMLELAYIKEKENDGTEDLITAICRYARQNYASDITTDTVCRKFYCSRSYISHTFKREVGRSFRDYLAEIRIDNAKRLLKYSALSVREIAFSVGFSDQNYFSGVFKKITGKSPLAYRKNAKNKE